MKTWAIRYHAERGFRSHYVEAESIQDALSGFARELALGAYQDIVDELEISQVVMVPYGTGREETR